MKREASPPPPAAAATTDHHHRPPPPPPPPRSRSPRNANLPLQQSHLILSLIDQSDCFLCRIGFVIMLATTTTAMFYLLIVEVLLRSCDSMS